MCISECAIYGWVLCVKLRKKENKKKEKEKQFCLLHFIAKYFILIIICSDITRAYLNKP